MTLAYFYLATVKIGIDKSLILSNMTCTVNGGGGSSGIGTFRVIVLVRVMVVVVIRVVVTVMLVVACDLPHFQQLSYILFYAVTLKLKRNENRI